MYTRRRACSGYLWDVPGFHQIPRAVLVLLHVPYLQLPSSCASRCYVLRCLHYSVATLDVIHDCLLDALGLQGAGLQWSCAWKSTLRFSTCWPYYSTIQQQGPPLQTRRLHDLSQLVNVSSCLKDVFARRALWRSSIQVFTGPPPCCQKCDPCVGPFLEPSHRGRGGSAPRSLLATPVAAT